MRPVQPRTPGIPSSHRLACSPVPQAPAHRAPAEGSRLGRNRPKAPGSDRGRRSSAPPARRVVALGRAASPRADGGVFGVSAAVLTLSGPRTGSPPPPPPPPSSGVSALTSSQRALYAKTNPGRPWGGKGADLGRDRLCV